MLFHFSRQLREIIESRDWQLYDITSHPGMSLHLLWPMLEKAAPAGQFEHYHQYIFLPKPERGQTAREVHAAVTGIWPSVVLPGLEAHIGLIGDRAIRDSGAFMYVFTRLSFKEKMLQATSLESEIKNSPILEVPYKLSIKIFEKYFGSLSIERR